MPAKPAPRRSSPARSNGARRGVAAGTEAAHELDGAVIGDQIEVRYKNGLWYPAKVIGKKKTRNDAAKLRYRFDGNRKTNPGKWIDVSDEAVRWATTEDNAEQRHIQAFGGRADGHLEQDSWEVECILDERGDDDAKQFKIRWAGWDDNYDSWEPASAVLDFSVVAEFRTARDAARDAAEAAARAERARYASTAIGLLRSRLLTALRKQARSQRFLTVAFLEQCDEWLLLALYEFLAARVPDGDDASNHLTEITTKGGPRARRVDQEFSVTSHYLLGALLDFEDDESTRRQHVCVRPRGAGTAVALLPTMTFCRRGLRETPHKVKLFVKAGFGTLVGRNDAPPDWHFERNDVCICDEPVHLCVCEAVHYGSIARRVMDIEEGNPGSVNTGVVALCRRLMVQA